MSERNPHWDPAAVILVGIVLIAAWLLGSFARDAALFVLQEHRTAEQIERLQQPR